MATPAAAMARSGWWPEMVRLWHKLAGDRAGAAAVEFAVWSSMFFVVALGGLDVADLFHKRSQMGEAVAAGAMQSFAQRDNVNFANLPGYVRSLSGLNTAQVTLACNGIAGSCTNFSRTCACLRQNGTFATQSCGAPCSGAGFTPGSTAGYYLTISANEAIVPVLLPGSALGQSATEAITVRLQ